LHDGPTLTTANNNAVLWSVVAGVTGNAHQSSVPTIPSGATVNAKAFSLNGTLTTGVPEPSTLALLRRR
jgi:hypothetical protein